MPILEDAQTIDFKYQERQPTSISDLETMTADGLHNVVATFKWVDSSPRLVDVAAGKNTIQMQVRDALLVDNKSCIILSGWGDLVSVVEEELIAYKITDVSLREFNGNPRLSTTGTNHLIPRRGLPPFTERKSINLEKFTNKPSQSLEIIPLPNILNMKLDMHIPNIPNMHQCKVHEKTNTCSWRAINRMSRCKMQKENTFE